MKILHVIFILMFSCFSLAVSAEVCPAPSEIKARSLSTEYDWSVDETVTLEQLINVSALFSVRIKNKNEYIACYYRHEERVVRLDGLPLGQECRVYHESNNWQVTEKHEWYCNAEDKYQCQYRKKCE